MPPADPASPLTEDDVLIPAALRFDGYAYMDETGVDPRALVQHFQDHGTWPTGDELDLLSALFMMQRWLYKWGGETQGRDTADWQAVCELFLATWNVDVPERFRLQDVWADRWDERIRPRRAECVATVRGIHEATRYRGDQDGR